jgi:hypothetical protein
LISTNTILLKYHKNTADIALFCSEGLYWIGAYNSFLVHQNGEPPYMLIKGYFNDLKDAEGVLDQLTGCEF